MQNNAQSKKYSNSENIPIQKTFLGHPYTLGTLFSLELWERFSFYGMQAILAYYMYYTASQGGLGMDKQTALSLVGTYGGTVYLCTILGAWLADRVLGGERVLFYSAIMIMAGHISLAVLKGGTGLAVGLILVAIGSGGLKTNATSIVGTLYKEGDSKRDAGFSIFYMAINIGALIGPLITGVLQSSPRFGFHYGFGVAAIGMAVGLVIYAMGRDNIPKDARKPTDPIKKSILARYGLAFLVVVGIMIYLFLNDTINLQNLAEVISDIIIISSIIYFIVIYTSREVTKVERLRVVAFIPLFIASVAFFALFQQQFTFIALYSDVRLDRVIFGWEFPASWVQSINPIFIILFAGVFATTWQKMGKRQPSTPIKFAIGLILVAIAFLCFIPLNSLEKTPLWAFILIMLLITWAELFISPMGLSVSTKLAPKAFRTQMVSLFFLSIALGTTLSGTLTKYYVKGQEVNYFIKMGGTCLVLGIILILLTPWIKKLMNGVE